MNDGACWPRRIKMKKHFASILTIFLFLSLLLFIVLLPASCDLFNPTAVDDLIESFERDNPADYGFWKLETVIENPPEDFYPVYRIGGNAPPFLKVGDRVFGITGRDRESGTWTNYGNIFFNPADNWSWVIVDGPALTLDGEEDAEHYRNELDAYFVIDDTLYWLGNGPETPYNVRFQSFDFGSMTWVDKADFPEANLRYSLGSAGGKGYADVYTAGSGYTLIKYDPGTNTWTDLAVDLDDFSRGFKSYITIGNTLFGVEDYAGFEVHAIDLTSGTIINSWQFPVGEPFSYFSLGSRFYAVLETNTNGVFQFDCADPEAGFSQNDCDFPGTPYDNPAVTLTGPASLILEGFDGFNKELYEYIPASDSWEEFPEVTEGYSENSFENDPEESVILDGVLYNLDSYCISVDGTLPVWSYKLRS
jgi:hypothetical protein